ncbi:MAG: sigma-70 family RNA polymerase sigma factor [Sandaracinus sp.]|nr:sigma-70 family RNA polymerase sigma factor [Sandaracinus sp.]MCB9634967.1 sigma-70 family RNA polymerase sigma factor [Sandaracinus sp.]
MSAAAPPSPRSLVLASGASEGESEGLDPLVARAKEGDQAAFQALFRQHRDAVARTVHRFLGPSADLEDVVQDVFVHVYRSLPSFRGDAKFTTWLYRLTANVTKMHLRRARSRPRFADVQVPEATDDATAGRPDELVERNERVAALYRLLDRLSDKKRTVLVLHDLEGLQAKEIAEIVDCPVLTVRTRLFYARKELYAALAEEPALAALMDRFLEELPGRPSGGDG